jgi:hypothetical protein
MAFLLEPIAEFLNRTSLFYGEYLELAACVRPLDSVKQQALHFVVWHWIILVPQNAWEQRNWPA